MAYDARGHGDSGWDPNGNYAYETVVEDLKCLCDGLGCDDPVLVGVAVADFLKRKVPAEF